MQYINNRIKKTLSFIIIISIMFFLFACVSVNKSTEGLAELAHTEKANEGTAELASIEKENEGLAEVAHTEKANEGLTELAHTVATRSKVDKINFVGDVFFSHWVRGAYDQGGIKRSIDTYYMDLLQNSDFNVGNLECAITDDFDDEAEKQYTLAMPTSYVKCLKEVNLNLLSLANNHILDFGKPGLFRTMGQLTLYDIDFIGAGKNAEEAGKEYIKEIDGKKYAFISASAVLPDEGWKASDKNAGVNNGYNVALVAKKVKDIKKSVDKVIVFMHWGIELEEKSNERQKRAAHLLVDNGADLVIGAHPHVVQEIEYYKEVPIVYSLGNFIFGMKPKDTMLLEATFDYSEDADGKMQLRVYPGFSDNEQVRMHWQTYAFTKKCDELQKKSPSTFISNTGFIFSLKQVEEALNKLATSSEIN